MNKLIAALFLPAVVLLNSACSAPQVETKKDSKVDVSQYRGYRWLTTQDAKEMRLENPQVIDYLTGFSTITQRPDLEPQLKTAVNQELGKRGFHEAPAGPDFYVTFYGKAKDQDWVSTWQGRAPSINNVPLIMYPGYDRAATREYRDGSIILTFYDAKTKAPVWTGIMANTLDQKHVDIATVEKDLGQLVTQFTS